jgi:hypothetical protein
MVFVKVLKKFILFYLKLLIKVKIAKKSISFLYCTFLGKLLFSLLKSFFEVFITTLFRSNQNASIEIGFFSDLEFRKNDLWP